jgi:predicted unusual protein kinase regulating ubiquinone biosynthesis (AarF/ABC1/UbiB family)
METTATMTRTKTTSRDPASPFARVLGVVDATADLVIHVLSNVEKLVTDVTRDSVELARESEALFSAASAAATQVQSTIRMAPRFSRILRDVVGIMAAYRIHRARALLSPAAGDDNEEVARQALHRASAEKLYRLCVELRGGLLKVGQFASSRVDLLPAPYVDALSRLQDRVPPVPTEAILARIESELGAPAKDLFASFQHEPAATASLAQVHRAVLLSGQEVAVKVQIPGIEETVEIDLAALRVLANVLGDMFPELNLVTIAKELSRSVLCELDYRAEAEEAEGFRREAASGDGDGVIVPRIVPDRSARRVLTMEWIQGERLVEFLEGCEARGEPGARDRDRICTILVGSFCRQVLDHGRFHADPHPGNFLVVPSPDGVPDGGPKLAILDFGSVKRYAPEVRRAYARLAGAIIGGDGAAMAELFEVIGFRTKSGDPESLRNFADLFMDVFRQGPLDQIHMDPSAQIKKALEIARENPIVELPQDFVLLGRVFASLGGLLVRYRPRIQLFSLLLPYMAKAAA